MVDPAVVAAVGVIGGGVFGASFVSTLRGLRLRKVTEALEDSKRQALFWEGQYRSRSTQFDDLAQANSRLHGDKATIIAKFDELKQLFDVTDQRRQTLDDIRVDQSERIQHLGNEIKALQKAYVADVGRLQEEKASLKAALAEASKNDKRDAKGRFTKAIEASLAQESL